MGLKSCSVPSRWKLYLNSFDWYCNWRELTVHVFDCFVLGIYGWFPFMFGGALGIFGTDAKKMVGCLPLATSSRALSDHELRLFPKCYMLNLITDDYSLVASNPLISGDDFAFWRCSHGSLSPNTQRMHVYLDNLMYFRQMQCRQKDALNIS